jgi:hypothetical protein
MGGGQHEHVGFLLSDGQSVTVTEDDLRRVYEELWNLAHEPGAVSTAALLLHEWQKRGVTRTTIELAPLQSDVLRKAITHVALPDPAPPHLANPS